MTNHAKSISPDLRDEIHHHAQGSIGLGLLRQTSPDRVGPTLTASLADEGWRWLRAHYDAEIHEAAETLAEAAKEGDLARRLWEHAEVSPRLTTPEGVLLVLRASRRRPADPADAQEPDLRRQAFYAIHEDLKAALRTLLPACATCGGEGEVAGSSCTICEGTGVRLS